MGKLLRLRDYVLIAAAASGDFVEEVRNMGGLVPKAFEGRYGYIPNKYKKSSCLTTVSQMLSTGDIKKVTDNKGNVYLELTSLGKKEFRRRFSLFLQRKKWDGLFMVVIFDIPEEERKVRRGLRTKLIELGFGMLQKSVWISPYHFEEDMREFLAIHSLDNDVFVLSAKKLWAGDLKDVAEKVWKVRRINKGYKRVIKKLKEASSLEGMKRKKTRNKAHSLYFDILRDDPLLPKEFLPSDWAQEKAQKVLRQTI
ncbi:MAG: CRISPR-associated endonuclease Cas2 [Patescibacteria group bacterium]